MIIGIVGRQTYIDDNLEGYLIETRVRGFWWGAEICYARGDLNERSAKLLVGAAKESIGHKSLHAWIKGGHSRPEEYSAPWLLVTVSAVIMMLGIVIGCLAAPIIVGGYYGPFFGILTVLVAPWALFLLIPIAYCVDEALPQLLGFRLQCFYRHYQPMRLTFLVEELVDAVADQLRHLETPLPEGGADNPKRARLKLACTMSADELERFALENGALIRALDNAHSKGIKISKLELREAIGRLRDGAHRIAIQIDTRQRMALESAQRQRDEQQRREEWKRLHEQTLRRLEKEAALTQVHTALGWSPEEAAARRAFDELEAAKRKPSAKVKQLVKQLKPPRKGKKSPRKEKSKRGKKSRGKKS